LLKIEKLDLPQHIAIVAICDQSTAPGGLVRFKKMLGYLESLLRRSAEYWRAWNRALLRTSWCATRVFQVGRVGQFG